MEIGMFGLYLGIALVGIPFLCISLFPQINTERGLYVVFTVVFLGCALLMFSAYAENLVHQSRWLFVFVYTLLALAGVWMFSAMKKLPKEKDEKKKED